MIDAAQEGVLTGISENRPLAWCMFSFYFCGEMTSGFA